MDVIEKKEKNQKRENHMKMEFAAKSENEGLARVAVAAFLTVLDPTLEEIADVKTAVSEAVTNAIIHGYDGKEGSVYIESQIEGDVFTVWVKDKGVGIQNVEKAMEPMYTSKPEMERSGMGFSFMEAFMDNLQVDSEVGKGTCVQMIKKIGTTPWIQVEAE